MRDFRSFRNRQAGRAKITTSAELEEILSALPVDSLSLNVGTKARSAASIQFEAMGGVTNGGLTLADVDQLFVRLENYAKQVAEKASTYNQCSHRTASNCCNRARFRPYFLDQYMGLAINGNLFACSLVMSLLPPLCLYMNGFACCHITCCDMREMGFLQCCLYQCLITDAVETLRRKAWDMALRYDTMFAFLMVLDRGKVPSLTPGRIDLDDPNDYTRTPTRLAYESLMQASPRYSGMSIADMGIASEGKDFERFELEHCKPDKLDGKSAAAVAGSSPSPASVEGKQVEGEDAGDGAAAAEGGATALALDSASSGPVSSSLSAEPGGASDLAPAPILAPGPGYGYDAAPGALPAGYPGAAPFGYASYLASGATSPGDVQMQIIAQPPPQPGAWGADPAGAAPGPGAAPTALPPPDVPYIPYS